MSFYCFLICFSFWSLSCILIILLQLFILFFDYLCIEKLGGQLLMFVFFMGLYTGFYPPERLTEWLDWIKSKQYEFLKLYLYVHRFSVTKSHMCLLILNQNILSLETELTCFAMLMANKTINSLSDSEKNKWLWNILMYYTATYKMTNTIFGLITNFDNIFFSFFRNYNIALSLLSFNII